LPMEGGKEGKPPQSLAKSSVLLKGEGKGVLTFWRRVEKKEFNSINSLNWAERKKKGKGQSLLIGAAGGIERFEEGGEDFVN